MCQLIKRNVPECLVVNEEFVADVVDDGFMPG